MRRQGTLSGRQWKKLPYFGPTRLAPSTKFLAAEEANTLFERIRLATSLVSAYLVCHGNYNTKRNHLHIMTTML